MDRRAESIDGVSIEPLTVRDLPEVAGSLLAGSLLALHATDLCAGVAHGNRTSVRVVLKNGFTEVARFDTYTRFHRPLHRD